MLAFVVIGATHAVIVQKVILKNGSVLEGYIQSQDGSGRMTVHTDRATIVIDSKNAEVTNRQVSIGSLTKAWKEWGEKNDAFYGAGDDRTLPMNEVMFKDAVMVDTAVVEDGSVQFESYLISHIQRAANVKVLEHGVKVKYLELTPNNYVVSWKDIQSVKADRRAKTALSGINRIYELRNGRTYEGQYAEETDNTLSLYMENGMIQSFDVDDVVKYTFRPINPDQDIFEQSELIDVFTTRNGAVVRGIVLEQNYSGKKDSENLFLVQTPANTIQTLKVSDILELRKEENTRYNPLFDVMLKNGQVMVNRKEATIVNVKEKDDLLVLDSINEQFTFAADPSGKSKIVVEYRLDGNTSNDVYQLVKIVTAKVKKKQVYCFSYKSLVNTSYRPKNKVQTSVNHTTKVEYELREKGIFALYDALRRKAIPFVIK